MLEVFSSLLAVEYTGVVRDSDSAVVSMLFVVSRASVELNEFVSVINVIVKVWAAVPSSVDVIVSCSELVRSPTVIVVSVVRGCDIDVLVETIADVDVISVCVACVLNSLVILVSDAVVISTEVLGKEVVTYVEPTV